MSTRIKILLLISIILSFSLMIISIIYAPAILSFIYKSGIKLGILLGNLRNFFAF